MLLRDYAPGLVPVLPQGEEVAAQIISEYNFCSFKRNNHFMQPRLSVSTKSVVLA